MPPEIDVQEQKKPKDECREGGGGGGGGEITPQTLESGVGYTYIFHCNIDHVQCSV